MWGFSVSIIATEDQFANENPELLVTSFSSCVRSLGPVLKIRQKLILIYGYLVLRFNSGIRHEYHSLHLLYIDGLIRGRFHS